MKDKKYLSLYHTIKNNIQTGKYPAGSKLPSKRIMSDKTGFSVITVEKAYTMLIDEGYVLSRQRSGYFVADLSHLSLCMDQNVKFPKKITPLPEDITVPADTDLEYSLWFKTIRKVISEKDKELFIKSPNKGCHLLRNAIADYLLRYRGMTADPACIIIGSGAEQLYETVVKILGRDKIYGIEDPSYSQIEQVYKGEGAMIEKLPMGADGIEKDILLKSKADVLHVTPFRSFPTGVSISASKKYEYLNWAGEGKYIVEDDFNSEFFMPGQPVETLYSIDMDSVIYINTFSKSLSPSMRIGYMIIPEKLLPVYNEVLGKFSCSVPVLDQYVLAEFISSGNFERHLNRVRRKMRL